MNKKSYLGIFCLIALTFAVLYKYPQGTGWVNLTASILSIITLILSLFTAQALNKYKKDKCKRIAYDSAMTHLEDAIKSLKKYENNPTDLRSSIPHEIIDCIQDIFGKCPQIKDEFGKKFNQLKKRHNIKNNISQTIRLCENVFQAAKELKE
ncbi:MAG: hypothetical protein J6C85_04700 [Alphaproteobacteria bacterium]|nr:hypothetical protein [Alphaproteobacteria bacterium]